MSRRLLHSFPGMATRTVTRTVTMAATLAATLVMAGPAAAAPQILGLVATPEAVPLTCENGQCTAQFSAFCMQIDRRIPSRGRPYTPGPGSELTLSFDTPDGKRHAITISHAVTIKAERGFHSVRIAVPETLVKSLGGRAPAITIAKAAAAIPVVIGEELKPLNAAEIARVTGEQRHLVDARLPPDSASAIAVATLNRLINAMPPDADPLESLLGDDDMPGGDVWQKLYGNAGQTTTEIANTDAVSGANSGARGNDASLGSSFKRGKGGAIGASHPGRGLARKMYDYCKGMSGSGIGFGTRECLMESHDHKTLDITEEAWEAEKVGM
jgi:hypothetical protein